MITLLTVKQVSAAVVTFPLYIAVFAFVEVVLVGGRVGPRLRRADDEPGAAAVVLDVEK